MQVRDPDTPYQPDFKAMGVKQQFETGFFRFVNLNPRPRAFARHRRGFGRGLRYGLLRPPRNGARITNWPTARKVSAGLTRPFTWQIAEAFKIENGLITRIEAILQACPQGMKPGR